MLYEFNGKRPVIDPSTFVAESAVIIGDVEIGPRCYIGPNAVIRGDQARIVIGEETAVEDNVVIHISGVDEAFIGKRVTIGHSAIVHSTRIGDGANIGMGAAASLYSEIGEYAVVAECALVRKGSAVPDRTVVGGIPAKVLRTLEEKDIAAWEETKADYVRLAAACNDPAIMKRIG